MLDPEEQATDRFGRAAKRDALDEPPRAPEGGPPLASLYELLDALGDGNRLGDPSELHFAILSRLETNRRHATVAGWTSCKLEYDRDLRRLRLTGVAPAAAQRTIVPDWTAAVAADARARRVDAEDSDARDDAEAARGAVRRRRFR